MTKYLDLRAYETGYAARLAGQSGDSEPASQQAEFFLGWSRANGDLVRGTVNQEEAVGFARRRLGVPA